MSGLFLTLLASIALAGDEPSDLVPELELENYTKHPVNTEKMHYKPGKGLVIASEDNKFSMAIGLRAMFLYEVDNDPFVDPGELSLTQSIQIRRARITFSGNMWGEDSQYKVELAISPRDEAVDGDGDLTQTPLLSWEHHFTHLRDLSMRVGQYKIDYSRERVVSSSKLAMVDRSLANSVFNLDRDIGIELYSRDLGGADLFQYTLGVLAGEGRGRFESNDFGLLYLGRINLTPGGTFDDYEPQDFDRTGPRFSIGAAYAYADRPQGAKSILDGGPADAVYNYHNVTVDTVFKAAGFSTEAAWFLRDGGDQFSQFAETGMGYYIQPHYLLPRQPIGLAARWGQILPEEGSALSAENELGPGVNWYMYGARNKMKLQADYLRFWSDDITEGEDQVRVLLQAML